MSQNVTSCSQTELRDAAHARIFALEYKCGEVARDACSADFDIKLIDI